MATETNAETFGEQHPAAAGASVREPEFSVIVSCFNEEESLPEFGSRLSAAMGGLGRPHEIIYVNDGSRDGTFSALERLFEKDAHVSAIIDLFNNSGQEAAITAGCVLARGSKYILIDSDLQLEPEEIPLLVSEHDKGYDIVNGYRWRRKDPLPRRVASRMMNLVVPWLVPVRLRDVGCNFRVVDAEIIRAFDPGPCRVFHLCYMLQRVRRYSQIRVTHHPRKHGRSGWTPLGLASLFLDNTIGLFRRPFLILGAASVCLAALGLAAGPLMWACGALASPALPAGILLLTSFANLVLSMAVGAAVGEYALRNHAALLRHPGYVVRTVRKRDT